MQESNATILDEELTKSFRFQNRELLDNYVILAVTDISGIIKHVSTNLCNVFKYKESDLLDKPYTFLVKKDSIISFENQFNELKEYKETWKGEVKNASSKDEIIWADTIITPLFNDDHEHIGFILASNDITQEKKLKKINEDNMLKRKQNDQVLDFMPSLSAAVLLRTSSGLHKLLWIITFTIIFLIGWSYFSKIDDIVKTNGKIISTKNIQTISSLDGGILEEMRVKEGDFVKKGTVILKISDLDYKSQVDKSTLLRYALLAKMQRLEAESKGIEVNVNEEVLKENKKIMDYEISLFRSNKKKLESSINILKEQLEQKRNDLSDSLKELELVKNNYSLLEQEIEIKEPLVRDRIISKVDYLQLKIRLNETQSQLKKLKGSIPTLKSFINESKKNILEAKETFKTKARDEIVSVFGDLNAINEELNYLKQKVKNTIIVAPNDGVINKITIKTKGEAISPGKVIVEIIPESNYVLAQVKVSPADIGFLYVGQPVKLKLRAYDFSLYGGIMGEISYISADTLIDEKDKDKEIFIVQIKSKQKYVGETKTLTTKPGMTVDADIITGKKSILDFVLKPILRSLQI